MKTSRRNLFVRLAAAFASLPLGRWSSQASSRPDTPPTQTSYSYGGHNATVFAYCDTDPTGNQGSRKVKTVITTGKTEYRYDERGRLLQTITRTR